MNDELWKKSVAFRLNAALRDRPFRVFLACFFPGFFGTFIVNIAWWWPNAWFMLGEISDYSLLGMTIGVMLFVALNLTGSVLFRFWVPAAQEETPTQQLRWYRLKLFYSAVATLVLVASALHIYQKVQRGEPEIALVIGEPYEAMRQRSSAQIAPAIANASWYNIPEEDARLRFIDSEFGYVTPLARFFAVMYDDEIISSVRMSPQVEPLLLDDALKVVLDIQTQLQRGGWKPVCPKEAPPYADTPAWRARLRDPNRGGVTYWQAGDKYQVMLLLDRHLDVKHPKEERYLITLSLARPWIPPEEP